MEFMIPFVTAVHIGVCILIVITVLLQPGKGGDLGSIFGGSTQTIFGASGALPFLTKLTRFMGFIFIVTSLSLGYISAQGERSTVIKDEPAATGSFGTQEIAPEGTETEEGGNTGIKSEDTPGSIGTGADEPAKTTEPNTSGN